MILFGVNIPIVEVLVILHLLAFYLIFRLFKNIQKL